MSSVVVVGGGVIGCAAAYYLARSGADVTLLERGELAGEASGAAAGMLAALSDEGGDRGPDFQQLCLDSLELFETLIPELAETGIDLRYNRSGVLHVALTDAEAAKLKRRFDQQQPLVPENRWLDVIDLHKVEPHAAPNAIAGLLSPREHYLDPQRLTLALSEGARRAGATIRTGVDVTGLLQRSGRVTGVSTASGDIEADAVLLAGGPWTAVLAKQLGAEVPVRPVRGQMLSLRGPAPPLGHIIWGDGGYLVPREDGQTYVGATVEEAGFARENTDEGISKLRSAAETLVPELAKAGLVRSWAGLRPATPDGLPILGLLPGSDNAWVATGHFRNGILLAPISGQLMAQSILDGKPLSRLQPFSPSRFVS